jgi:hypothetical protein
MSILSLLQETTIMVPHSDDEAMRMDLVDSEEDILEYIENRCN